MIWTYNDDGYLVSVDLPEEASCRMCGAVYKRRIQDARPWQAETPDACPQCGHPAGFIAGIRFENAAV